MTKVDPDAIGPDGTVRLCCYLPSADAVWFSAGCDGQAYRSCCPAVLRSLNTQSAKAPATGFLALCVGAPDAEVIQ